MIQLNQIYTNQLGIHPDASLLFAPTDLDTIIDFDSLWIREMDGLNDSAPFFF